MTITDTSARSEHVSEVAHAAALLRCLHPDEETISVCTRGYDERPPNCSAFFSDGTHVGVEVIDFVDEDLVLGYVQRMAQLTGRDRWAVASEGIRRLSIVEVAKQIESLLQKKDVVLYHHGYGPFDRYIVLIHAAAPFLRLPLLQTAAQFVDVRTRFIDEAYALMTYDLETERKLAGGGVVVPVPLKRAD